MLETELVTEWDNHEKARSSADAAVAEVNLLKSKVESHEAKIDGLTEELDKLKQTHEHVHGKYRSLKQSFTVGVEKLFEEIPTFMAYYGLVPSKCDGFAFV